MKTIARLAQKYGCEISVEKRPYGYAAIAFLDGASLGTFVTGGTLTDLALIIRIELPERINARTK